MVCSFQHTNEFSPSYSRVTVFKDDRNGLDYPVICHQCAVCPPVEICPNGAITKNSYGWTAIESDLCAGCGLCQEACEYDTIKLTGKAIVCDLCNGEPECVKRCSTGALKYGAYPESRETPLSAFSRLKELWNLA